MLNKLKKDFEKHKLRAKELKEKGAALKNIDFSESEKVLEAHLKQISDKN